MRLTDLAAIVGVVSQETYLLHTTVRENLRYAKPGATDTEIEDAARAAQIHDLIAGLPDGYDTMVGSRGHRFSGGEKQRIAIARTLLRDPRVLVLDEATSALDTETERAVQTAFDTLARGRTTITIAHRLSTVRNADQIVVLDHGRVIEAGTHTSLIAGHGRYADLAAERPQGALVVWRRDPLSRGSVTAHRVPRPRAKKVFSAALIWSRKMSEWSGRIKLVFEVPGTEVRRMCDTGQPPTPAAALALLESALDALNNADVAALPAAAQAECLRVLERAGAKHTAARASVLAAFTAQGGFEGDGQRCARSWLKWQTRVTGGAAAGAVGWVKRLAAHPAVRRALAAGAVSASWAREICAWSDLLPEASRAAADEILLAAADGGAALADLAALAQEMRRRCAAPNTDGEDGFDDRGLDLGVTFGGAGRVTGDLTPGCTAALSAVLEALGKKAGPEDVRTAAQRRHDALEEACRRLVAAGGLPGRAGQPTQIQLHLTLDQLRGLDGAADAENAWAPAPGRGRRTARRRGERVGGQPGRRGRRAGLAGRPGGCRLCL